MTALRELALKVSPRVARIFYNDRHRERVFRDAMRRAAQALGAAGLPVALLADLVYGWGNEQWSAREEFMQGFLVHAMEAAGPILECGSGLSTLLLGLVAQRHGLRVWTLEHNPFWAERIRAALAEHGVTSAEVCLSPLRSYDGFTWYDPPLNHMPDDFALVVCDGPPYDTPGGRYGLLPVMREHLRPGAVVLLDDAQRPDEQAVLGRWSEELGTTYRMSGSVAPYARLVVPS